MSPRATFNLFMFLGAATSAAVFTLLTLVVELPWVISNGALMVAIGLPFSYVSKRSARARKALVAAISPSLPAFKYWPKDFGIICDRYINFESNKFDLAFNSYRRWGLATAFWGGAALILLLVTLAFGYRSI